MKVETVVACGFHKKQSKSILTLKIIFILIIGAILTIYWRQISGSTGAKTSFLQNLWRQFGHHLQTGGYSYLQYPMTMGVTG